MVGICGWGSRAGAEDMYMNGHRLDNHDSKHNPCRVDHITKVVKQANSRLSKRIGYLYFKDSGLMKRRHP